jgi:hypothetical protein
MVWGTETVDRRQVIVIAGNGEIASGDGRWIDTADLVIRFNDCRSTAAGGSRTDVVAVCNTGRPAKWMLSSKEWRTHPAVQAASEIWSIRDPRKFAAMRAPLAKTHPELDDFCDDYTAGYEAFAARTGKRHLVIDQAVHNAVDNALSVYRPAPYVVPSSGMIVIGYVLEAYPKAEVVLAGFGHHGWEWHPFAAERQLIEAHVAAGRLARIGRRVG